MLSFNYERESGISPVVAVILIVAITVILAVLVYLFCMNIHIPGYTPSDEVPTIFEIRKISSDPPKYESKIILINSGMKPYDNSLLEAEIYSNGNLLGCVINTMHGHDFIPTRHFFVKTMWGLGCSDFYWNPGEKTGLDLTDGLIKPGDRIKVEILTKPDDKVISTDTYDFN
ncbi:flagellin-like protein [Methanomicrobium sp. W14]|uniref:archaellin/type IV pilin N-terminal domain-containing protein n=1 Tax=Methanomicrobium sp. W14 TaxID=2817839 RepID=UPI001AE5C952|nr:archaellin/type IV pilin N-terminal domain-containing protein [Methanomicrobium sp. W14]MBP2132807.1 flagellin-like protein [Methanomicrobium sp. W14]